MSMDNIQNLILKNGLKILFGLIILITFLYILSPFIIPATLGAILAMAFSPFVEFFIKKGLSRKNSLRLLSLIIFLIGVIPSAMFFIRGSQIITQMIKDPEGIANSKKIMLKLEAIIHKFSSFYGIPQDTLMNRIENMTQLATDFFLNLFSSFMSQIPDFALLSIITFFSFYFFLEKEEAIRQLFDQYFFFSEKNGNKFISMMKSCCKEVFFSNVLTGIIQAIIVSIGTLIFGVGDFFLIFFITFIASFIPIIGAGPIALIISFYTLLNNQYVAGIALMVIAVLAGISDNIIRPYIASLGTTEVPAFIGFMAVIGGVIIFGLPGLFLAPLVAAITFGMIPIFFDEYFKS